MNDDMVNECPMCSPTSAIEVVDWGGESSPNLPPPVRTTPLVRIENVFIKLECMHPCGSVKDRIAAYILKRAKELGHLRPGQPIVEATSGNTGIAFAYYGAQMGHPVTIVMPEHMTEERKAVLRKLGATLILCSSEGSFAEAAEIRDRIAQETGAYNPDQFGNPLNVECHRLTTAEEIRSAVERVCKAPSGVAWVAGVGTGGTLIGVAERLKAVWTDVAVIAVEPTEAAVMTGGPNGPHGIFGIGDGFIPEIASDGRDGLHPLIDAVEVIGTEEAMAASRELSDRYSLCVGVSSGANFAVARRLAQRYPTVITVFADGHHKYHSAGITGPEHPTCPFHDWCSHNVLTGLLSEQSAN
jgi:cysteine synthase A